MKTFLLKSLELRQFQSFEHIRIDFAQKETIIVGENGSGKTTIYSALSWLMFGKDSDGREKFDIKRLVNGVKKGQVDVEVTGVFHLIEDGHTDDIILKRVLTENYDRKGQYKGDQTLCYINGVPKLVGEYREFISSIVSEEEFKMLTSVSYFLSKPMEEQREYLCQMAGVKNLEEFIKESHNPIWVRAFEKKMRQVSIDDHIHSLKVRCTSLNGDIDKIQPSINAIVSCKPGERDWAELERKRDMIQKSIDEINDSIASKEKAASNVEKHRRELSSRINELTSKKMSIGDTIRREIAEAKTQAFRERADKNIEYGQKESELKIAENKKALMDNSVTSLKKQILADEQRIDQLVNDLTKEKSSAFQRGETMICPIMKKSCASEVLQAQYYKEQDQLEKKFNEEKEARIAEIKKEGRELTEQLAQRKQALVDCEGSISEMTSRIKMLSEQLAGMTYYTADSINVDESSIKSKYVAQEEELDTEIERLRREMNETTADAIDNSELLSSRDRYTEQMVEVIKQLSDREQIQRMDQQIANLEKQGQELADEYAGAKNDLTTFQEIRRALIEDAATRINAMFQVTHWQTSVQQKNGDYKDVCQASIDGVSISLNTAKRINVGLDIANAIGNYKGIRVPLFIDSAESVNEFINIGTQVIKLIVAPKGTKLTINPIA